MRSSRRHARYGPTPRRSVRDPPAASSSAASTGQSSAASDARRIARWTLPVSCSAWAASHSASDALSSNACRVAGSRPRNRGAVSRAPVLAAPRASDGRASAPAVVLPTVLLPAAPRPRRVARSALGVAAGRLLRALLVLLPVDAAPEAPGLVAVGAGKPLPAVGSLIVPLARPRRPATVVPCVGAVTAIARGLLARRRSAVGSRRAAYVERTPRLRAAGVRTLPAVLGAGLGTAIGAATAVVALAAA